MNINKEKYDIYKGVVDYFGDITMIKCREIPNSNLSIYYARIGCLLCVDDRYVVVICEDDNRNFIGYQKPLSAMPWISLQTRTIEKPPMEIQSQNTTTKPNMLLSSKIKLNERGEDRYTYFCNDLPLKIELLCTENDKSYAENGTVSSALETYQCVLSFLF